MSTNCNSRKRATILAASVLAAIAEAANAQSIEYGYCTVLDMRPGAEAEGHFSPVFQYDPKTLGGPEGASINDKLEQKFSTFAAVRGFQGDGVSTYCFDGFNTKQEADAYRETDWSEWSDEPENSLRELSATTEEILGPSNLKELTCSISAVSTEKFGGGVERLPPRDWHVKFDETAGYLSINNAHIWQSGDFEVDFGRVRDANFSQDFITFCPTFAGDCGVRYNSSLGMATVNNAQINRRNGAFEWTTWDLFSAGGPNGGAESVTAVYTGTCAPAAPPRF